jgi:serine/threonine protein kinase
MNKNKLISFQSKFPNSLNEYELTKLITKSENKNVYRARLKNSNDFTDYCLKEITINEYNKYSYITQVELLKKLKHKHILKLFHYFYESSKMYILFEYCNQGSMSNIFNEKKELLIPFSEKELIELTMQLLSALMYFHAKKVVHRNINLNTLLMSEGNIKITGWGISMQDKTNDDEKINKMPFETDSLFGNPYFMSPEVALYKNYDFKIDLWSIGILIYTLVNLSLPFTSLILEDIRLQIINKTYNFSNSDRIKNPVFINILNNIFQKDPNFRISAKDAYIQLENEVANSNIQIKYEKNSKKVSSTNSLFSLKSYDSNENNDEKNNNFASLTNRTSEGMIGQSTLRSSQKFSSHNNVSKFRSIDINDQKDSKDKRLLNKNTSKRISMNFNEVVSTHLSPEDIEKNANISMMKINIKDIDLKESNFNDIINMAPLINHKEKKKLTVKDFQSMN